MCLISASLISIYGVSIMRCNAIKNVILMVVCFTIAGIMFYYFSGYATYFDESEMKSAYGFSVLKYNLAGNELNAALEAVAYFVLSSMLVFGVNLACIKLSVSRKTT